MSQGPDPKKQDNKREICPLYHLPPEVITKIAEESNSNLVDIHLVVPTLWNYQERWFNAFESENKLITISFTFVFPSVEFFNKFKGYIEKSVHLKRDNGTMSFYTEDEDDATLLSKDIARVIRESIPKTSPFQVQHVEATFKGYSIEFTSHLKVNVAPTYKVDADIRHAFANMAGTVAIGMINMTLDSLCFKFISYRYGNDVKYPNSQYLHVTMQNSGESCPKRIHIEQLLERVGTIPDSESTEGCVLSSSWINDMIDARLAHIIYR